MKLAEAVAIFLERQGITHIFGVNGGANLHLIHGIYDKTQIKFISTATETGAGYAADAYARIRGLGVAMATSGPGATNLVTAIAAAWQDSTPVLFITGNCATFRKGTAFGVRSYGFQELEFVTMTQGITKFAMQPKSPTLVIPMLQQAIMHAQGDTSLFGVTPRKGPVVVDIPDDVQRMDVEEWTL